MGLQSWSRARYLPVSKSESSLDACEEVPDAHACDDGTEKNRDSLQPGRRCGLIAISSLAIACFLLGLLGSKVMRNLNLTKNRSKCDKPSVRHEWRSLSLEERQQYIEAVKCLTRTPSTQLPQDSLYDDFAYVHIDTGNNCKLKNFSEQNACRAFPVQRLRLQWPAYNSASFLPYHRYLLHSYEQRLKVDCGYSGFMSYVIQIVANTLIVTDLLQGTGIGRWTGKPLVHRFNLSSYTNTTTRENLAASPIFSNLTGFGSISSAAHSARGVCVTDNPLSEIPIPYYDEADNPHCIRRALPRTTDNEPGMLPIDRLKPSAAEALLSQETYQAFLAELRKNDEVNIPNGIVGGFLEFTAPNNPLFFLHHAYVLLHAYHWINDA